MEDQTVVYVAGTVQQAYLLKNLLADQGIQSVVLNETLERGSGVDYVGWSTLARVAVKQCDAVAAREIALKHDQQGVEMAEARDNVPKEYDDDVTDDPSPVPTDWPRCPECGKPRVTCCPICKTTGTDFPEADDQYVWGFGLNEVADDHENKASCGSCGSCDGHGSAMPQDEPEIEAEEKIDHHRFVLMCPMCSEPFLPEYPRRCAWCDHEFEDGFEPEEIIPTLPESNTRVAAIVVGLMLLTAVTVGYFMFVLGR